MKRKRRLCHHCGNYYWHLKTHQTYVKKATLTQPNKKEQ